MNLKRRDSSAPDLEEKPAADSGKKPVIIYILVLFLVAFLLMTLSLLSHQRSNTEAIGQLQGSVTAMQEVQGLQEQVIQLQKELAETRDLLGQAEADAQYEQEQAVKNLAERDMMEFRSIALLSLYQLEQHYSAGDLEACKVLIEDFECGLANSLPREGENGVTSPAEHYEALKDAIKALER